MIGIEGHLRRGLREEFVADFVFPMFRANAVYEGVYLLGTSIARPLIAKQQVEIARKTGADAVCSRRHRQGQRPGALRAVGYYALEPDDQGHRAVARVGVQAAHRPDQRSPNSTRSPCRRTSAAKRRSRSTPTFCTLLRGQGAGGPVDRAAGLTSISAPSRPMDAPDTATDIEIDFVKGDPVALNGKALSPATMLATAQRSRPRQRHRPRRPGREPFRRHEVARRLRDARRHHPA